MRWGARTLPDLVVCTVTWVVWLTFTRFGEPAMWKGAYSHQVLQAFINGGYSYKGIAQLLQTAGVERINEFSMASRPLVCG